MKPCRMALWGLMLNLALAAAAPAEPAPAAGLAATAPAPTVASAPAVDKGLILDETSYCRSYYQFGCDAVNARLLKEQGEKLMGKEGLVRLERETKKLLAERKLDWSALDWRDHAVVRYVTISHHFEESADRLNASDQPPPNAAWASPDFDDAAWGRFRKPFTVGPSASMHFSQWSMACPGLQASYLRFYFQVADPARAGRGPQTRPTAFGDPELTLSADYIGGVRVFVNGHELTRGHLPAGPLGPEALADGYAEDAYMATIDDLPKDEQDKLRQRAGDKPLPQFVGLSDWRTPVGSRVYKARNRTLGPLKIPAEMLRKGANVLAFEVHTAPLHPMVVFNQAWTSGFGRSSAWLHCALSRLELRAGGDGMSSGVRRPAGMQAWAEDMHRRVFSPEFLEAGASPGASRLVAARNGTYSGQVVVGSDRELSGVKLECGPIVMPQLRGGARAGASRAAGRFSIFFFFFA